MYMYMGIIWYIVGILSSKHTTRKTTFWMELK